MGSIFPSPPAGDTQIRPPRMDEGADLLGNFAGNDPGLFGKIAQLLVQLRDPMGKAMMGMGGGNASGAAVLPQQVLQATKWAQQNPSNYMDRIMGPTVAANTERTMLNPALADWATKKWKNIGGPGETAVVPLKVGGEGFPMNILPLDEVPGRDPMSVLKLYLNSPAAQNAYSNAKMNLPQVLPTMTSGQHPSKELSFIEQPFANMLTKQLVGRNPQYVADMVKGLNDSLLARQVPLAIRDPHYGNFGEYRGKWYVVDPGAIYQPTPAQLAEYRAFQKMSPPGADPR